MNYSLDSEYEREAWAVLLALRANFLERGSKFTFDTDSAENLSRDKTVGKLLYLERQGMLKYIPPKINSVPIPPVGELTVVDYGSSYPAYVAIELHEKKFIESYTEYSKVFEANEKVNRTQKTSKLISVRLIKDGLTLYLKSDDQRVDLNRFRADLTPEKLVNYLLTHANTVVPLSQIKLEGEGFRGVTNVSEILRKAGFTETVKKYFLPQSDKTKVRLVDQAHMETSELEKIKAETLKIKSE